MTPPSDVAATVVPDDDAWGNDPTACEVCGLEMCEGHDAAEAPQPPPLRIRRARDVIDDPAPAEIVEGFAWANCLTVLVAESGAGKTFLMADLAAAVSDGVCWHGRDVLAGSVVYFSFEGDAWTLRLDALSREHGRRLEHLYLVRPTDPISPVVQRGGDERRSVGERALVTAIGQLTDSLRANNLPAIVLMVIDTVRASLTGSEDASEHVSAYLRAVRRVMACVPGAACVLIHHAGWQDGEQKRRRERGSSAWRGNCDATVYLEAKGYDPEKREKPVTLQALKVRDGENLPPLPLVLRQVELPRMNRHGEPVTTCVIELDRRSPVDRDAERTRVEADQNREMDVKVFRAICDHSVTSVTGIRGLVGGRNEHVTASLVRLSTHRFVIRPVKQGQPYTITDDGLAWLSASGTT